VFEDSGIFREYSESGDAVKREVMGGDWKQ
jgi:hypothetical protein